MSGFRRATGQTIDLSAAARPGSGSRWTARPGHRN